MADLTPKQERFCQEYIIDLNATQAYIRAKYTAKDADVAGPRLLGNVGIKDRIEELMAKRAAKVGITQERVLQEYARLAFFDIRNIYDEKGSIKKVTELDDDTAAALVSVKAIGSTETEYKLADKKGALDSVARHLGMFEKDNKQRKTEINLGDILEEIDGRSADLPEDQG